MSETITEAPHGEHYALGDDIEVVRRSETLLLFARGSGRTVRVSAGAVVLLPLLQVGATFEQLRGRLGELHPSAPDIDRTLRAFLRTLTDSGVLRGAAAVLAQSRGNRKFPLFSADGVARALAWPLRKLLPGHFGSAIAVVLALAAAAAVGVLAARGGLPGLRHLAEHLHWVGLLLFAVVVVPLHELAHAVACRLVGVAAGQAGVLLHAGIWPGPYVETNQSYLLTHRWQRFAIPAAGPFVDLVAAGTVAAVLAFGNVPPTWTPVLQTLLFVCLLFVYFDTNPFTPSDGSHCLEALLEDELARRNALSLRRLAARPDLRAARRYRVWMAVHLIAAVAAFVLWAR